MGWKRKALFIGTSGLSRVAGVKVSDPNTRTARSTAKQVKLQKQELKVAQEALQLQRAVAKAQPTPEAERSIAPPVTESKTLVSELARLASLHRAGSLTDDEFKAAKERVINSHPA